MNLHCYLLIMKDEIKDVCSLKMEFLILLNNNVYEQGTSRPHIHVFSIKVFEVQFSLRLVSELISKKFVYLCKRSLHTGDH